MEFENKIERASNLLEAALFLFGDPISNKKAEEIINEENIRLGEVIELLKSKLINSGLMLIETSDSLNLVTNPSFNNKLIPFVKNELEGDLSNASLETLAIIAYFGPLERFKIDYIRGINSSIILRNLAIRGLVNINLYPDNKNYYSVSVNFLKNIGLGNVNELENYVDINAELEKLVNLTIVDQKDKK